MTEASKLDSLIGLARRAGCLAVGTTATEVAVKKGRAYLVILAADLAGGSREALERLCRRYGVPWINYKDRRHLDVSSAGGTGCFGCNLKDICRGDAEGGTFSGITEWSYEENASARVKQELGIKARI